MEQEVQAKANADEVPVVTSTVTDADLDAAAEGKTTEEKVEKPEEKEVKTELKIQLEKSPEELAAEEEHKERSRLGRKLAKVEEELLEQRKQTNELMELLRTQFTPRPQEEKPDIPEYITTPQELEQYLDYREKQKFQKQQNYHQSYAKTVFGFKPNDPDIHAEILKEMDANFRAIPTGEPAIDARINYSDAKAAYFAKLNASRKVNGKEVPLAGGKLEVPTGLSGGSRVVTKEATPPKLDSVAQEYVDYLKSKGMKQEEINAFVKSTLEGEAPAYIGHR